MTKEDGMISKDAVRDARVAMMQVLYTADLNGTTIEEAIADIIGSGVDSVLQGFIDMVVPHMIEIDQLIEASLVNYTLARLNVVDRCIIRVAVGEMLAGNTHKNVIINEALEITKEYSDQGDHKAVAFNNRLLDNISKRI